MAESKVKETTPDPVEVEAKPAPLTVQDFSDQVNALIDKAIADGLRPLPVVATILAKRGMGLMDQARATAADVADRFLASLEGNRAKTEKKEES